MMINLRELERRGALSAAHAAWLRFACEHAEVRDPASFNDFRQATAWHPYRMQPWPTFISRATAELLEHCACGFEQTLKDVFARYFDYDAARLAAFHHGEAETIDLLLTEPDGIDAAFSRVDVIITEAGPRILEINLGSALGGWNLPFLGDLYRSQPLVKRFIANQNLEVGFPDSLEMVLAHARAEVEYALGITGEINIGVMVPVFESREGPVVHRADHFEPAYDRILTDAGDQSGRIVIFNRHDYVVRGPHLFVDDVRIHAVIEQQEVVTPNDIFRLFKAGGLFLFSGPAANILSDKRYLALLSSLLEETFYTEEEREVIERFLPWTRMVSPGPVRFDGEEADMAEVLERNKANLVLKRVDDFGGAGVVVGPRVDTATWEQTAAASLRDHNWIAQTYQASEPITYLDPDRGPVPHDVVWGLWSIGGGFGGALLRMKPGGGDGVINAKSGASESISLEVDA